MAKKTKKDTDNADTVYPAAGQVSRTSDGSHESVSYGDGTARQRPIVNSSGEYPPRPADFEPE